MKRILWSLDSKVDLVGIVSFIKENSGGKISRQFFERIQEKVKKAASFPESDRIVPELHEIGVTDIREIMESPWRILFRTNDQELRIVSNPR